jgi:hypothetical protein
LIPSESNPTGSFLLFPFTVAKTEGAFDAYSMDKESRNENSPLSASMTESDLPSLLSAENRRAFSSGVFDACGPKRINGKYSVDAPSNSRPLDVILGLTITVFSSPRFHSKLI